MGKNKTLKEHQVFKRFNGDMFSFAKMLVEEEQNIKKPICTKAEFEGISKVYKNNIKNLEKLEDNLGNGIIDLLNQISNSHMLFSFMFRLQVMINNFEVKMESSDENLVFYMAMNKIPNIDTLFDSLASEGLKLSDLIESRELSQSTL
jgi:hypothetical protein